MTKVSFLNKYFPAFFTLRFKMLLRQNPKIKMCWRPCVVLMLSACCFVLSSTVCLLALVLLQAVECSF